MKKHQFLTLHNKIAFKLKQEYGKTLELHLWNQIMYNTHTPLQSMTCNEVLRKIREQGENQCYYAIFEGLRKAYEGDW